MFGCDVDNEEITSKLLIENVAPQVVSLTTTASAKRYAVIGHNEVPSEDLY